MATIEEKLFKQPAYWVSELVIDNLIPSVYLQLIANPDNNEVECSVTFNKVQNITSNFHGKPEENKNEYLCTLLGIDDTKNINGTKYTITTDTTEVSFVTSVEPNIEWVNPEKPFKKWKKEIINVDKS